MFCNKLELCTFAANSPDVSKLWIVRVLFWVMKETPGDVERYRGCRASVERQRKGAHKPIKFYRREKTWQQLRKSESS